MQTTGAEAGVRMNIRKVAAACTTNKLIAVALVFCAVLLAYDVFLKQDEAKPSKNQDTQGNMSSAHVPSVDEQAATEQSWATARHNGSETVERRHAEQSWKVARLKESDARRMEAEHEAEARRESARQAEEALRSANEERAAVLDIIAQINHINWVVCVIKTYNNAAVLEEEYAKISYDNLVLDRIPDEEALGRIKNTLDALYSLRKDEREMKHWLAKFRDQRMRKMRQYDLGTAKRTWGLFKDGIMGLLVGDVGSVLQTAFDVGHGALSLQYDYDDFVNGLDLGQKDKLFAFDSEKLEMLHRQNKEMLDDQWRLVRKYKLNDMTTRVTPVDINALLTILKDGNPTRIYNRLAPMQERFKLFPEYWYYLSCAAMETGHFEEGREACDTFFKVNRGIFRDDPMAGTVALNKAVMLGKDKRNFKELRRCLEIAWKNNQNKNEWAQDFLTATLYNGVLGDNENATVILEHAIAGLEAEMSERMRKGQDIAALAKNLGEYHAFLFRLLKDKPMPPTILASEFISCTDKLRSLARQKDKARDVWGAIREEILGISLTNGATSAVVPANWLLYEDISVRMVIFRDEKPIETLAEDFPKRKNNKNKTFTLSFSPTPDKIKVADSFRLVFSHSEFPVTLTFASNTVFMRNIDAAIAARNEDLFLYEFSALDRSYRWLPDSGLGLERLYSDKATRKMWHDWFSSRYSLAPLNKKSFAYPKDTGMQGIEIVMVKTSNETVSLEYRNATNSNFRPVVTLLFLNDYGSVVGVAKDLYYEETSKSHRTEKGIIFDDHYTDYLYTRCMAPNGSRTFSAAKPDAAHFLCVAGEVKHNMNFTLKGTH